MDYANMARWAAMIVAGAKAWRASRPVARAAAVATLATAKEPAVAGTPTTTAAEARAALREADASANQFSIVAAAAGMAAAAATGATASPMDAGIACMEALVLEGAIRATEGWHTVVASAVTDAWCGLHEEPPSVDATASFFAATALTFAVFQPLVAGRLFSMALGEEHVSDDVLFLDFTSGAS